MTIDLNLLSSAIDLLIIALLIYGNYKNRKKVEFLENYQEKLYVRISKLEDKVKELQNSKNSPE